MIVSLCRKVRRAFAAMSILSKLNALLAATVEGVDPSMKLEPENFSQTLNALLKQSAE